MVLFFSEKPLSSARSHTVNPLRAACILLVVISCLTGSAWAQKKSPGGARVLLLSGGQRQHHGYRDQAFYLAGLLENTGRYEVTLSEDAAVLVSPTAKKYDV